MDDTSRLSADLRQAKQDHRVHPAEAFVWFEEEDTEQSIPQRFEQQVSRHPDRLAVKTKSRRLTYAALNKIANRVARTLLAQREVGVGRPVARA
jgi:non-ribosomal peptide synthetase component F